jgi:hypothetical protein
MLSDKAKRIGLGLCVLLTVVFVAIQFVPVDRTNPPVVSDVDAPPEVEAILRRSCYDCHSHETRWPWYGYVAPISWFLHDHIEEAREDLDFSDWPTFDFEAQALALQDIREQIRKGEMPLRSYLLLHGEARLSDSDRRLLIDWAESGF